MAPAVARLGDRLDRAEVAQAAPAVVLRVAVQELLPRAPGRHADPVIPVGDGREVAHDQDEVRRRAPLPQVADDTVVGVVEIDPLEPGRIEIELVEGRLAAIELVEVLDPALDVQVRPMLEGVPLQALLVGPFLPLGELAAHEEELLAGMGVHVPVEGLEVGILLHLEAGHLAHERALAVDDLVVRQGQDEVLRVGVPHAERQVVLAEFAEQGVLAEIGEHVVHPAHLPLEAEAQAAQMDGPGDHGPGRRFLRGRLDARAGPVRDFVEAPEEAQGLEVLPAAVAVGDPLPLLPGIVEVEHRGHGVDAEAVGVVALEPEQGRADEELADLVAAVVEDRALPVGVEALARVLVLVERGAVEPPQAVPVGGEMRRHPVQDDADAEVVEHVHEVHEVLRRSVAAGRGEVADGLVAPRSVERVLHDRHDLDVREAHLPDVFGQERGDLPIGQRTVVLLRDAPPRPEVDLVDGDRGVRAVGLLPPGHPFAVAPAVVQVPDDRGRPRRGLGIESQGVGLLRQGAVELRRDGVLVESPLSQPGDEALPDAGAVPAGLQGMADGVPAVEVADHGNAAGVGGPDGEMGAVPAVDRREVGPELVEELEVVALFEEVDVPFREKARPVEDVPDDGRLHQGGAAVFRVIRHVRVPRVVSRAKGPAAAPGGQPASFPALTILAHSSRRVTVRLKTRAPGFESRRSAQK